MGENKEWAQEKRECYRSASEPSYEFLARVRVEAFVGDG
jgi:hypothetical protein